jgi:co-chaperonin GroES (HSP10)
VSGQEIEARLRPFWGRVLVVESPVDEEQRQSGLIVPHKFEGSADVRRGVVVDVDGEWSDPDRRAAAERLPPGTVVWYRGGTRVGEFVLMQIDDVLAYET